MEVNWKCPICGIGSHNVSSGESSGNCSGDVIFLKRCAAAWCLDTGEEDVALKPEDVPCSGCSSKLNTILEGKKKVREIIHGLEQEEGGDGNGLREVKLVIETVECELQGITELLKNSDHSDTTIKFRKLLRKVVMKMHEKLIKLEDVKFDLEALVKQMEMARQSTLSTLTSEFGSTFEASEASEVISAAQSTSTEENQEMAGGPVAEGAIVPVPARDAPQGPVYLKVAITDEAALAQLAQSFTLEASVNHGEVVASGNVHYNEMQIVNTCQVSQLETSSVAETREIVAQACTSPIPSTSKGIFHEVLTIPSAAIVGNEIILRHDATPADNKKLNNNPKKRPLCNDDIDDNGKASQHASKIIRSEPPEQVNKKDLVVSGSPSQPSSSKTFKKQSIISLDDQIDDLHTFFRQLPAIGPRHFHELLLTLKHKGKLGLFKERCPVDNATPLHLAFKHIDVGEESLLILSEAGLNFNLMEENDDGDGTILYSAVKQQKPAKLWKKLIELGANPHRIDEYGANLLHAAAGFGCDDLEILEEFMKKDELMVNPKRLSAYGGKSPLHIAVNCRREEMVKFLIQHKALINVLDDESNAPIHLTGWGFGNSFTNNLNIFKELVNAQADMQMNNAAGETGLHVFLKNVDYWKKKLSLEEFKQLVEFLEEKSLLHLFRMPDKENEIPLELAVEMCRMDMKTLRFISSKIRLRLTKRMLTCFLHYAIKGTRSNEFLEGLVKRGANVTETDPSGATFLHIAAGHSSSFEPFQFLLDNGLSITALDKDGNSVLSWAIKGDQSSEIFDHLLRLSYDAGLKYIDNSKVTLLLVAATYGTFEVFKFILEDGSKIQFNVNEKYEDWTPFHFALCSSVDPEKKGKLLLEHGADPDVLTKNKTILLHWAVQYGTPSAVKFCLEELKQDPNSIRRDKITPLILIAGFEKMSEEDLEKTRLLLKNGANSAPAKTPRAGSVASEAILDYYDDSKLSFIKLLLENKADVNGYNYNYYDVDDGFFCGLGHTLIQLAVLELGPKDFKSVADLLMDYKVDFSKPTELKNKNVFHLASVSGNLTALKYIRKHNVPGLNSVDEFGMTPLHNLVKYFCQKNLCTFEWNWKGLEESMIWLLQNGAGIPSQDLFTADLSKFKEKFENKLDAQLKQLLWK